MLGDACSALIRAPWPTAAHEINRPSRISALVTCSAAQQIEPDRRVRLARAVARSSSSRHSCGSAGTVVAWSGTSDSGTNCSLLVGGGGQLARDDDLTCSRASCSGSSDGGGCGSSAAGCSSLVCGPAAAGSSGGGNATGCGSLSGCSSGGGSRVTAVYSQSSNFSRMSSAARLTTDSNDVGWIGGDQIDGDVRPEARARAQRIASLLERCQSSCVPSAVHGRWLGAQRARRVGACP